ncbi:hypothetical protein TrRE_jg5177 [Triparma retinervis]|uniref:peptidylprolyl isomerase n=1 Tax=Triparma retinervis TaxID=2557542 RepID=A0A9W7CCT8_9STRA|nr:hypothetical protein TrRE_jg5177 [Triparma retinervis]
MAALSEMSGMIESTFNVVWAHPRGLSLSKIVQDYSQRIDKGESRVFTQRPATKRALLAHIAKNNMVKVKSSFGYWVGSPIDVYIYTPPSDEEKAAHLKKMGNDPANMKSRYIHNVAADALTLKLNEETFQAEPSEIQPFGLCLIVAGGLGLDGEEVGEKEGEKLGSVSKVSVCKLYPEKGDQIDAANGEVKRAGASLGEMVKAKEEGTSNPGVVYPESSLITTDSGLKYVTVREGIGAKKPTKGAIVKAHYCGWLDAFESDKKFDSSRDKGKEFQTEVGVGAVIAGWDEMLLDMRRREQRMVIIPAEQGYGDRGVPGHIPSGSTLYFHIELLSFTTA